MPAAVGMRAKTVLTDESVSKEQTCRSVERSVECLRQELEAAQRSRDSALRENRRLQDDLAAAIQDCRVANHSLEESRQEVENLKRQLQDYVDEVRRVEEILTLKEGERSEMLEHFRSLSVEATVLESNNHSLESEAEETRTALRVAQEHVADLEQQVYSKDALVRSYENQVIRRILPPILSSLDILDGGTSAPEPEEDTADRNGWVVGLTASTPRESSLLLQISELTVHVASLETQLRQQMELRQQTEADLTAVRELCVNIDDQKEVLSKQNSDNDIVKIHLESELSRLREELEIMQQHVTKDRAAVSSLEDMLANSRHEAVEQRAANQSLQAQVAQLQTNITDLQEKLALETAEVRRYASQAAALNQQVTELQREVINVRFNHARATEGQRDGLGWLQLVLSPVRADKTRVLPMLDGRGEGVRASSGNIIEYWDSASDVRVLSL
uniref:Uncharacterized protein n=1 Tax=Timema monikensis TaxID=170555 RepID=A0A7R9HRZ0_9NEOP|nr:unnamed protein product [Timema monikensis]